MATPGKINEQEFLKLHNQGYTDKQLREHFDVMLNSVLKKRKKLGLRRNRNRKSSSRGVKLLFPAGVPMETALDARGQAIVNGFLNKLETYGKPGCVSEAMEAYQIYLNGYFTKQAKRRVTP
jgi:hypothetical protein